MVTHSSVGAHRTVNGSVESGRNGQSSTVKGRRVIIAPKSGEGIGGTGLSKVGRSNALALSQGEDVRVVRAPVLAFLSVPGMFKRAYKLPSGAKRTSDSEELLKRKTLGLRKSFTPMLPGKFKVPGAETTLVASISSTDDVENLSPEGSLENVDAYEPLILWQSAEDDDDGPPHSVSVDPMLCKFLRPHQREGVQFMYECVMGARDFDGSGCILADDMGLGKTLQSITVMWTLLTQGQEKGTPTAKRCIVVCPTSLVKNWESEIIKWLNGDCKCLALSESTRKDVIASITLFLSMPQYKVLILSYETFRIHSSQFTSGKYGGSPCDLLICDEAHRLKNCETATSRSLASLPCSRRILLSGTPMQNDLDEFYAMVGFANPGVLGLPQFFRKHYLNPILIGREPGATESEERRALLAQNTMSRIVNEFILRRTNTLNAQHLPPKLTQVVACRLTSIQESMYRHLLNSKEVNHILRGKQTNVLSHIGTIQKLCNHPSLILDAQGTSEGGGNNSSFPSRLRAELLSMLPTSDPTESLSSRSKLLSGRRNSRSGGAGMDLVHPEWSGKLECLFRLMKSIRAPGAGDDRIVIVSNYTSCLNLIGQLCRENSWTFVRLDGSTGISKRKKMVDDFNDPQKDVFAFLLSSKAGGCGLNLIGGNRLVLFDPDWNPAVDKQAAARVWRDHQTKKCYIYRFLSTGTIEEKIFQRQLSKEGLQSIVDDKAEVNSLSSKELRNLFQLTHGSPCDTHDKLQCQRCCPIPSTSLNSGVYEEACNAALPRQLAVCAELLERIAAEPIAKPFLDPLDPTAHGCTREEFEERVKEPIGLNIVLQRLSTSSNSSNGVAIGITEDCDGEDPKTLGSVTSSSKMADMKYLSVPAFVKDVNMVFSIPEKVWRKEPAHPLRVAANELKHTFDREWAALVQEVVGMRDSSLADLLDAKRKGPIVTDGGVYEIGNGGENLAFQEQLGMPAEEDLNNWSHHFSTDTVDDGLFQLALAGTGNRVVSFIFGLEVTWSRLQAKEAEIAKEAKKLEDGKIKTVDGEEEEESGHFEAASDGNSTGVMTDPPSDEEDEITQDDSDAPVSPHVLADNNEECSSKKNESIIADGTICAEDNQHATKQHRSNTGMEGVASPFVIDSRDPTQKTPISVTDESSSVGNGKHRGKKLSSPLLDPPLREKKKCKANNHGTNPLYKRMCQEEEEKDLAVEVNQNGGSCSITSGSAYVASSDQLIEFMDELPSVVHIPVDEPSVPLETLSDEQSASRCNRGDPVMTEQWECGLCTFINIASNKKCTMCATRHNSKMPNSRKKLNT